MQVRANGISIEVEDSGETHRPAVLLVMGLGMQLIAWPKAFVEGLHTAGYRVVRFDNRDAGLSQSFPELGVPNLVLESMKHRFGLRVRAPYSIGDMAADTRGVLDALRIETCHLVGLSMGGMIAQRLALDAPDRIASLTSIMSSSGARWLPGPKPPVMRALMQRPAGNSEEAIVDHAMRIWRLIGSPGFPIDDALLREQVVAATRRGYNRAGTARQMTAIVADTRRAADIRGMQVPTLVVHGKDDPLVPYACGEDTARRIPRAQLVGIHGMGHDLPPGVVERVLQVLLAHLRQTGSR
ncbi:alpha/beta hydrolase [Ramlibacter sp. MMS24-I3-19]|uniref:alpha/beta fold hydrolase n=1 Tax=Ramlibacter sp. MMS24-I3-19 TaxID=3416606 RepID=UPI003CFE2214